MLINLIRQFVCFLRGAKKTRLLFPLSCSLAIVSLLSLSDCEVINRVSPANSPVETTQAVTPTQFTLTTIAHFNGSNGSDPIGVVQGKDGNFYGVTASGGNPGAGTVFRLTPEGQLETLVNFNAQINGYKQQETKQQFFRSKEERT